MNSWKWLFLFFPAMSCVASQIDFEVAMGKGTPAWENIKTAEDRDRVAQFRALFEKNIPLLERPSSGLVKIPKEIHLIWLGPHPFPEASLTRVVRWQELHPDWKFHVWIDQPLPLNDPFFHLFSAHPIGDISLLSLEEVFDAAVDFGEKARLLSYALLYQRGGLYIDHDVELETPLDLLHENCDFYCQLEPLTSTVLSTTILPVPYFMGSTAGHPILAETIDQIVERRAKVEETFLATDGKKYLPLVSLHRTVWPFSLAVANKGDQPGYIDLILPPSYYARHLHEGSWKEKEQKFEQVHKIQLQEILLQHKKMLRWIYFGAIATLIAPALVLAMSWKGEKPGEKRQGEAK